MKAKKEAKQYINHKQTKLTKQQDKQRKQKQ